MRIAIVALTLTLIFAFAGPACGDDTSSAKRGILDGSGGVYLGLGDSIAAGLARPMRTR